MSKASHGVAKQVKRVLLALGLFLVVEYLVLPQIAGVRKSWSLLGRVNLGFVVLGFALEMAALFAYAKLTQAVIPRTNRPSFVTLVRIDLSTLSVSHLLPGGAAAGTGLGYRLLTDAGV